MLEALSERGDIVDAARRRWRGYEPEDAPPPRTLGVDGSHNSSHYQGVDLWIATSVAARPDGDDEVVIPPQMGLGQNARLPAVMREMEAEACRAAVDRAELVLMDGSLHAALAADEDSGAELLSIARENPGRVAFVSKTSDVRHEFGDMSPAAGDIYYYNRASQKPGFSEVFVKSAPGGGPPISSTYVRLVAHAPLIKVELLGRATDGDVQDLASGLARQSVGGYPNALKQAHNLCTITREDVGRIEAIIGIHDAVGARAVLQ